MHLLILLMIIGSQAQENLTTTTTTTRDDYSLFSTPTINATTTIMPTSFAYNSNITYSSSSFFSASPTTFVFTHYPTPAHTIGSSSSINSSARPSQSAPFPDDTIGKYGRLHISSASSCAPGFYSYLVYFFITFFFLVKL